MIKKFSKFYLLIFILLFGLILSSCGDAISTSTPTPEWWVVPTFTNYVPPSEVSEYTHYAPSDGFSFHLEFDYPGGWLLYEYSDEILTVSLGDPKFLTLPAPSPGDLHTTPADFGSIIIWVAPKQLGQTIDTELQLLKKNYSNTHWMKVLNDYKIKIDGYDASVLEYQVDDPETSPSLMFNKRIYFMVEGQVYEIMFEVAEKDRDGEFEKGFDYFLNSIQILP